MKKNVKFYPAAISTLSEKNKSKIEDLLSEKLDKSKTFKRAEVTTLGDAWHKPAWRQSKVISLTTMHVARLMKR